jgi:hypothetical protein
MPRTWIHYLRVAAGLGALACGGGNLGLPGDAVPPSDLVKVSGDDQSARAGQELPAPLVVRLLDEQGNGVPAGSVTWVVEDGGGTVSPAAATTDEDGLASVNWTLGPSPGPNSVKAVVSGVDTVTFTASATGGGGRGPDHLVFLMGPSDAPRDERITPPVALAVVDQSGAPVPDFKTRIRLELAEGSGKLGGKPEQDTKDGVAIFEDLRVDEAGDGKVLRALAPVASYLGTVESAPFAVTED